MVSSLPPSPEQLASSSELALTFFRLSPSFSGKAMLPMPSQPTGNFIQDVCDGRPDLYGSSFFFLRLPSTSIPTLLPSSPSPLTCFESSPRSLCCTFSSARRPLLDPHNPSLHSLRLLLPLHLHLSLHRQPRRTSRPGHRKDLLRRRSRLLLWNRMSRAALGGGEVAGRC